MNNKHRVFISFQIMTLFFSCMTLAMDPPQRNEIDKVIRQFSEESLKRECQEFEDLFDDLALQKASSLQNWDKALKCTVDKHFPRCVQPPAKKFTTFINICNQEANNDILFCKLMERKWLNLPAYSPEEVAEALYQMNLHYYLDLEENNLKAYCNQTNKELRTTPAADFTFHNNNIIGYFKFLVSMDPNNNIPYFLKVLDESYRLGDVPNCFTIFSTLVHYYDIDLKNFTKHTLSSHNSTIFNTVYSVWTSIQNNAFFEFKEDGNLPSLTGLFRVIENENLKTNFKDITISLYKAQRRLESHFKLGLKPKDKPDPDSEDKPDPNKLDPNSTVAQLATLFINMPPLAQEETTYALNKLANACPSHVLTEIDTKKLQDMSTADLVCYVEKLGKNKDSLRKTFLMGLYTGQDIANFLDPLFHRVFVLRHLLGVESGQAKYLAMVSDLIPFVTDDRVKETVQVCMPDPAVSPDPVQGKEDLLESDNKSGEHESSSSSENKKNLSTTREHKLSSTEKEDKTPSPSKPKMVRPFRSKSTKTADKAVDKEKNGDKFSKQSTENLHIQLKPLDESKPNTPESKKKYRNSKGSSPRNQTGVVKHEMQSEVEKESFRYHNPTPTVSNDIDDFLSNPINSLDGIGSNMKPRGISSSNTSRSTGKSIGEIGSNMKQPPKSTNTPKFIEASVPESDAGSNNKKGIASARFSDDPMTPPAEKAEKFFEGVGANMKPVKKKDQSTAR